MAKDIRAIGENYKNNKPIVYAIIRYFKKTGKLPKEADSVVLNSKSPTLISEYTLLTKKKRFKEAEPYISSNPYWSRRYAIEVLKRRWFEVEELLLATPMTSSVYFEKFDVSIELVRYQHRYKTKRSCNVIVLIK